MLRPTPSLPALGLLTACATLHPSQELESPAVITLQELGERRVHEALRVLDQRVGPCFEEAGAAPLLEQAAETERVVYPFDVAGDPYLSAGTEIVLPQELLEECLEPTAPRPGDLTLIETERTKCVWNTNANRRPDILTVVCTHRF